jgi:hypothetical protein
VYFTIHETFKQNCYVLEENAPDLAKAIYALQDTFNLKEFDKFQQDALVALLVAAPIPTFR